MKIAGNKIIKAKIPCGFRSGFETLKHHNHQNFVRMIFGLNLNRQTKFWFRALGLPSLRLLNQHGFSLIVRCM